MGSRERREREREAMRQAILEAALTIAAQEGWQAVTVRRVADRIEYSPSALYKYFEDKEAILATLLVQGFSHLLEDLRQAASRQDDPEERLLQIAIAYWRFVWCNPTLYGLMFSLHQKLHDIKEAKATFALVRTALASWSEARAVALRELDDAVDIFWATLHGLTSLALAHLIYGGPPRAQLLLERAVRDLLRAWQQAPWR
ncbi:TetR/AcrR family transcriptional regulator [Thermogemmatispora sp.]|uniref:TetR/AcrR family transcriptional regulator n=1 Tax=Thermogemmatispora sp. TaxID=1968838 RepID=UPI0035E45D67